MTPAKDAPTCNDCYFRRNGLCALSPDRVCPTFRAATLTLRPSFSPQLQPVAAAATA